MRNTYLHIRVDDETKALAQRMALIEDRPMSSLIRSLIRQAAKRKRMIPPDYAFQHEQESEAE